MSEWQIRRIDRPIRDGAYTDVIPNICFTLDAPYKQASSAETLILKLRRCIDIYICMLWLFRLKHPLSPIWCLLGRSIRLLEGSANFTLPVSNNMAHKKVSCGYNVVIFFSRRDGQLYKSDSPIDNRTSRSSALRTAAMFSRFLSKWAVYAMWKGLEKITSRY